MCNMRKPEMEVIHFNNVDIVAASRLMTWSKFGDGVANNGTVTYNGKDYVISSLSNANKLYSAMSDSELTINSSTKIIYNKEVHTLGGVFNTEMSGTGTNFNWGATYYWNESEQTFRRKQ